MELLSRLIDQVRAQAKRHFGSVAMARSEASWISDLRHVAAHAGAPWRSPSDDLTRSFDFETGALVDSEWWGAIELWPDSQEAIWFVRLAIGENSDVVLSLAPTEAQLHDGLERAFALWGAWRRVVAKARTSYGSPIELKRVAWDELYLPDALLTDVRRTVEAFAVARPQFESLRLPYRRGILFHGPPGNGKTMTTRAIVTALDWPMVFVTPDSVDESRDLVEAFKQAADAAPAVLVFEDVDSLLGSQFMMSQFLNLLDGLMSRDGILVVATTNHPELLDPSITSRPSRFDRVYEFAAPTLRERLRYLLRLFEGVLSPSECEALAEKSDGFSMAFLRELFVNAALLAVHRGALRPSPRDAREALKTLKRHLRSTQRRFVKARASGFMHEEESDDA